MSAIRLLHLYPELMNLYGDRGNLICLQKRLQWAGYSCDIVPLRLHEPIDAVKSDFIFMGGGSDREQALLYNELRRQADYLWEQIEAGLPSMWICGGYQLLGQYYETADGTQLAGLGLFDFHTQAGLGRMIGNVILETEMTGDTTELIGFENHGGRTYFNDSSLRHLGRVVHGFGNNGEDGGEGLHYKNLIATYLHGPLLPKNVELTDYVLACILRRRGVEELPPQDLELERAAHRQARQRIMGGQRG
ncbi:MAG: glutamine amidotransferase [Syntrophomonadaceae bacterium]|nr:glutamine amidotransferase [Syntrophomonadaceae bacterium]